MDYDFDLFVIGAGSGGVRAGRLAAATGAKVAVAEEYRYGGTCVIRGCVPKKLMVYASEFSEMFEDAAGYGWTVGETSFDWATLIAAKDKELERLEKIYAKNLGGAGAQMFDTRATVTGPHSVKLASGEEFSAKTILIATGGRPFVPNIDGSEHVITSNDIFHLTSQPKRALVVGGGYIACEFAGILNGMGTQVTQFYRSEQILRGFDNEVRDHVANEMRAKGIDLRVNTDLAGAITKVGNELHLTDNNGDKYVFDTILYATGRVPNTDNLGLETAGVELGKKGEVIVDQYSRTNVDSIYAIGDVTDRVQLTPVAIREGVAFVETVFHDNPTSPDHELIPTAVFTQPEIGTVGMGEEEARSKEEIEVYSAAFRPMKHILAGKDEKMLMKLIVSKATRVVLGVHIVGHAAGEMIQLAGIAVKMGATKEQFDATVAVHPTAAEELVTMKSPTR
ncbi:glutathione-disulfide reductase [Paramylibacter ulvae]|nr:glutathione-disulfide reductase [Amylibacter ulvae]